MIEERKKKQRNIFFKVSQRETGQKGGEEERERERTRERAREEGEGERACVCVCVFL